MMVRREPARSGSMPPRGAFARAFAGLDPCNFKRQLAECGLSPFRGDEVCFCLIHRRQLQSLVGPPNARSTSHHRSSGRQLAGGAGVMVAAVLRAELENVVRRSVYAELKSVHAKLDNKARDVELTVRAPRPSHMSIYYRWIATGPDLQAARLRSLQVAAAPRTACWIFQLGDRVLGAYMPNQYRDRVLVAFVFDPAGEAILNDQSRWVRFPGPAFRGEAQHPDGIIVKSNEPGAYGVGQLVLQELNRHVRETRLASRQEMSKVLGRAVPRSQVDFRMKNQRW